MARPLTRIPRAKRPSPPRRRKLSILITALLAAPAASDVALGRDTPFSTVPSISEAVDTPFSVEAADIDGDGDLDALAPAFIGDAIYWFENTAGNGSAWTLRTISTALAATNGAYAAHAVDLDEDGDLDVISAAFVADTVFWHENVNGDGSTWSAHTIATLVNAAAALVAADFDGDGDLDVASAAFHDDEIAWYENDGSAGTWTAHVVLALTDGANSVSSADLDGDGDMDLLSTARDDDTVLWHENTAGDGSTWSTFTISNTANSARSVVAADVDGDGHLDVVSGSGYDGKVAWYRNINGDGSTWSLHTVTTSGGRVQTVFAADADMDGDVDLFSAGWISDNVTWHENTSGDGTGWTSRVITTNLDYAYAVAVADVDGDGDLDALSASGRDDKIAWYRNDTIHRSAAFPGQTQIFTAADGARTVFALDVDGDGDVDALSASIYDGTIAWYENDGAGSGWMLHTISTAALGAYSMFASDMDGDGDVDALSASFTGDTIAWYENDGTGGGWMLHTISTTADGAASVYVSDVDGDGDGDVLSAAATDDAIAWYENDGAGGTWTLHTISTAADGAVSVFALDVDNDGDIDALSASYYDSTVAWYENDGAGGGWTLHTISTATIGAYSVFASDVDGDGDIDALSASFGGDTIAWHENDGAGGGWTLHTISTAADGARFVISSDVDGDGDTDALSASSNDNTIAWYENGGAGGSWTLHTITTGARTALSVFASDVDGDGDIDVLSASASDDTIAWYENRGGQFALPTLGTAQKFVNNASTHDLLDIQAIHRGRMGDSDAELVTLELKLTDGAGVDLTNTEADNLIEDLEIWLDDGSGAFEAGSDTVAHTVSSFSLTAGVQTVTFNDGNANAQLPFGSPKVYFVVADITADADSQTPSAFQVGHVTDGSSTGEDAPNDIPLTLEFWPNTGTGIVDTALSTASCQAPFDLQLSNRTVTTSVACEAGTFINAGDSFVVGSGGGLSLSAGQSIRFTSGFHVDTGTLTVTIDTALQP